MDITKKTKLPNKKPRSFTLDEENYERFKKECDEWNQSMSEIVNEFVRRVGLLLESRQGGEVVFGVEGSNWKQPKKVLYDGKEITERDGIRTTKKEGDDNKK